MSLLSALLDRGDPLNDAEARQITPWTVAWDRGDTPGTYYDPAGVLVDRDTMLGVSAVWACVSLISDSIATLPLGVYETQKNAPKAVADQPDWLTRPNPEQTLVDFKFGTVASLLLHGNAYIYTVRDRLQNIVEAWLLDPRWVYPRREFQADGSLGINYYVNVARGMQSPVGPFKVPAGPDMFHIMAFQPNSSWPMGISPLDTARMMFGSAIAGQEMGTRFFSQGMNAAGVIEVAEDFTPDQARQLKRDFTDANSGGPRKMHYPPVLTGGATWKQIQISPEQSQFLEQRQFSVDEIARWFRVPPHMIGNLEKTSSWGAGIEQQSIGFVTYTLRPWLARIEKSWTDHMLTFNPGQYFRFDTTDLLRGDMTSLGDFALKMHMTGAMNMNTFRSKYLGMEPYEGGDTYYFPVNTAPIGTEPIRLDKPVVDIPGTSGEAIPGSPGEGGTAPQQTGANSAPSRGEVRGTPRIDFVLPEPDIAGLAEEVAGRVAESTEARFAETTEAVVEQSRAEAAKAAAEAARVAAEARKVAEDTRGELAELREAAAKPKRSLVRVIRDKRGRPTGVERLDLDE